MTRCARFSRVRLTLGRAMDDDIKAHLAAVDQWLVKHRATKPASQGLTSDGRKQLHAVNKSIQQLAALGVSIPDELRQLKLQLSAKDVVGPAAVGTQESLAEVAELIGALGKLSQAAKSIFNQLKTPGNESAGRQRYDVTLQQLVNSGHLSLDDKLEFSWLKGGPVFEGKVRESGALAAKLPTGWKEFESLSAAAEDISDHSLNGWMHWRRINSDGSRTTLKDIRAKFMKEGGAA